MTTATFVVDGLNLVTNAGHFDIDHSVVDIERLNLTLSIDGMRGSQDLRKHPWLPARDVTMTHAKVQRRICTEGTLKNHIHRRKIPGNGYKTLVTG